MFYFISIMLCYHHLNVCVQLIWLNKAIKLCSMVKLSRCHAFEFSVLMFYKNVLYDFYDFSRNEDDLYDLSYMHYVQ